MNILIWLLTFVLILDCLLLILLVLIQLPKKEAGLGQAFGGGATDALFGAGSGSALTTLTRYSAGVFFAATLLLSVLNSHQARAKNSDPRAKLTAEEKLANLPVTPTAKPAATNLTATPPAAITNNAAPAK